MLIGYAKVSPHDQNLDLQQDALQKGGCEKIFVDEQRGAKVSRPGLKQAMDSLREGDTLVVWRMDRLGQSLRNLLELVARLKDKKVGFRSIQDSIDTNTTAGNSIFQVFGALAEFERNLIRERTAAALAAGRAREFDEEQRQLVIRLFLEQTPVPEILETVKIPWGTFQRYVRNPSL